MNVNDIHNAMNQIDDDMLESVDVLRNKHNNNPDFRKPTWIYALPMVACFFIIAAIAILPFLSDYNKSNNEANEEIYVSPNAGGSISDNENANDEHSTSSSDLVSSECPSVIVEIVQWNNDCFIGKVTALVDTNALSIGTSVTVRFESDVCVAHESDNEITYEQVLPSEAIFPVGSTVRVQFSYSNTSDFSGYTIYADVLTKIDDFTK